MLSLNAVHKSRGVGSQRYSLVIPALHLRAGEQLAIVGPSGCGKSTLLDMLALVLAPDRIGQFEFNQIDMGELWRADRQTALAQLRRRHLGYVLQTGGLLEFLDVRGNIALPRQLLGLKDDGSVARLAEQLQISDQLHKRPAALSVGQRQHIQQGALATAAGADHRQLFTAAQMQPWNHQAVALATRATAFTHIAEVEHHGSVDNGTRYKASPGSASPKRTQLARSLWKVS